LKKDQDLSLKASESNGSDLDDEEMAMVACKVQNSSRRLDGNSGREVPTRQETVIMIRHQVASSVENMIML